MTEAWEAWEAAGSDVAVAEISRGVSLVGDDGRNNGDSSVGAEPVEPVVSSFLADSHVLLGEEALKAGGSLGDN